MISPGDRITKGRSTHAEVTTPLLAPMPSGYKHDPATTKLYEFEHRYFDEGELRQKASELTRNLRHEVSLRLLPASMAVMETFSDDYAESHTHGKRRQARMKMQYQIGSMIGLATSCFVLADRIYVERHPHDVTSIQQNQLLSADQPPEDIVRNTDPKLKKIIQLVGEHTTADVLQKDPDQAEALITATATGYHVSRALARLSIEQL